MHEILRAAQTGQFSPRSRQHDSPSEPGGAHQHRLSVALADVPCLDFQPGLSRQHRISPCRTSTDAAALPKHTSLQHVRRRACDAQRQPKSTSDTTLISSRAGCQTKEGAPHVAEETDGDSHLHFFWMWQNLHKKFSLEGSSQNTYRREALSLQLGRLWVEVRPF